MMGYYIPARPSKNAVHLAALRKAAEQLDAILTASGSTENDLVTELRKPVGAIERPAPEMIVLDGIVMEG